MYYSVAHGCEVDEIAWRFDGNAFTLRIRDYDKEQNPVRNSIRLPLNSRNGGPIWMLSLVTSGPNRGSVTINE